MKKFITVIAAGLMLLAGTNAFAQMSFGAGYVNSIETMKIGDLVSKTPANGFCVGANYRIPLARGLSFTPGLNYEFITAKSTTKNAFFSATGRLTEHYINIPLTFSYGIAFGNAKAFVFAGPTGSLGLASTTSAKGNILGFKNSGSVNNYDDDDYGRFDILLGGGLGVEFLENLRFTVGYDFGLLNRALVNNVTLHRNQLTVGISYVL